MYKSGTQTYMWQNTHAHNIKVKEKKGKVHCGSQFEGTVHLDGEVITTTTTTKEGCGEGHWIFT